MKPRECGEVATVPDALGGDPATASELRCAAHLVAALYDLPPEVIMGPRKGPPAHVHARQTLCYLLRTVAGLDQAVIAKMLGRHRSTVGHSVEVVGDWRDHDDFDRAIERLSEMYREIRDARSRIPALVEALAA